MPWVATATPSVDFSTSRCGASYGTRSTSEAAVGLFGRSSARLSKKYKRVSKAHHTTSRRPIKNYSPVPAIGVFWPSASPVAGLSAVRIAKSSSRSSFFDGLGGNLAMLLRESKIGSLFVPSTPKALGLLQDKKYSTQQYKGEENKYE